MVSLGHKDKEKGWWEEEERLDGFFSSVNIEDIISGSRLVRIELRYCFQ